MNPMDTNPLGEDLDYVLEHTTGIWDGLRRQRLFITGGTGFFGCWLLESFAWANARLDLGASALVLTRDPEAFRRKAPHLATNPAIHFHPGDVRNFEFPPGQFSHIIHAATESSAQLNRDDPLLMLDTIVAGTRRVLDFARQCSAHNFMLVSSGAVYGRQPPELSHIPEDYNGAPDPLDAGSAYGEGKRMAELLCSIYGRQYGLAVKIARCFAFLGPYLPLNRHFAVGNFIRDALKGGPIHIKGDGTAYRSYLYAADLAIWLWKILVCGESCVPYNVGSETPVTVRELAQIIAEEIDPSLTVAVASRSTPQQLPERYVPLTHRASTRLQLPSGVTLDEAAKRAVKWHIAHRKD